MTQFDDRERAFEKHFELEEEIHFRVMTRAAKLFGLWAAGQMGLPNAEAEIYAAQVAETVVAQPSHEKLMNAIEQDLAAKGAKLNRRQLEKEMNECERVARSEVE